MSPSNGRSAVNDRINLILDKMTELENDLHGELKQREERFQRRFVSSVEEFKKSAQEAQQRIESEASRLFRASFWRHVASVPFIYGMIVPLAFMDLALSIYQHVCFRLYSVPRVRRSDHFIIDRHYLDQLSAIDKLNCVYCGYGNGVFSYGREIISRTEQYWCPIKHAQKTRAESARYNEFLEYGDTDDYPEKRDAYRDDLQE